MNFAVEMERLDLDDLWALYAEMTEVVERRVREEKLLLEERLRKLGVSEPARRTYPPVLPKYRNPELPSETWAGRGKQPRWLVAQLEAGRRLDDFKIQSRDNLRVHLRARQA